MVDSNNLQNIFTDVSSESAAELLNMLEDEERTFLDEFITAAMDSVVLRLELSEEETNELGRKLYGDLLSCFLAGIVYATDNGITTDQSDKIVLSNRAASYLLNRLLGGEL